MRKCIVESATIPESQTWMEWLCNTKQDAVKLYYLDEDDAYAVDGTINNIFFDSDANDTRNSIKELFPRCGNVDDICDSIKELCTRYNSESNHSAVFGISHQQPVAGIETFLGIATVRNFSEYCASTKVLTAKLATEDGDSFKATFRALREYAFRCAQVQQVVTACSFDNLTHRNYFEELKFTRSEEIRFTDQQEFVEINWASDSTDEDHTIDYSCDRSNS